jgi:hypothetical protein
MPEAPLTALDFDHWLRNCVSDAYKRGPPMRSIIICVLALANRLLIQELLDRNREDAHIVRGMRRP